MPEYATEVRAALDAAGPDAGGPRVWQHLGKAGVLAALYPPPARPGRASRPSAPRLAVLLGEVDCRYGLGVSVCVCVQAATAVPVLAEGTASAVVDTAWRDTVEGRALTALAATDAGAAGSDLTALTTTVRIDGGLLTVDGAKRWVTAATVADRLLVLARHRPGAGITAFTWVLVPADAPGVTIEAAGTPFFGGSGVGHVTFRDVRLGAAHVVGRVGAGLPSFARNIATERLAGALTATALTRRVLRETRRHLTTRQIGGRPMWDNESIRQRYGRWVLRHRELEALCARLAPAFDTGSGLVEGTLLKASAGLAVEEIVGGCARLFGADGFGPDGPQWLRAEAELFAIGGGVTELMLAGVADSADQLLGPG